MRASLRPALFLSAVAFALLCAIPFNAHAQVPTCTLIASPSVLDWSQTTVTLSIISSGASTSTVDQGVGVMPNNGTKQVTGVTSNKTFTATVTGLGGTGTCIANVYVQAQVPGFDDFGVGDSAGGGGGGGNPLQALQGLAQTLGGLAQLQGALGGNNAQNAQCNPVDIRCPCGVIWVCTNSGCGCKRQGPNMHQCTCTNRTGDFTTIGKCAQPNMCLGGSSGGGSGALGGGQQGLAGGLGALSSIMQGLQGLLGQGGGASGGGGGGAYPGGYSGCLQYYNSPTPSSDPCAIYQPGVSGQLGGTTTIQGSLISDLLNALGGNSNTNTSSSTNTNTNTNTNQSNNQNQTSVSVSQNQIGSTLSGTNTGQLRNSLAGDVRLGGAGATVFANLKQGLTEVAGFFGGSTFGGSGSQSALSRLCGSRPWASGNFLGSLAPDGFFDGLCRAAGYQVGQVQQTGGGVQAPSSSTSFNAGQQQVPATTTAVGPYIPPEVDIRAEPSSVRLGTRTYIFWSSRGVSACAVTGPNFTQNTLSGAGATVPITGPTTFAIECAVSNASSTIRDSVTVNLAI